MPKRFHEAGIERQRPFVTRQGLVEAAQRQQRVAADGPDLGRGRQRQRFVTPDDGLVVALQRHRDRAEVGANDGLAGKRPRHPGEMSHGLVVAGLQYAQRAELKCGLEISGVRCGEAFKRCGGAFDFDRVPVRDCLPEGF